SFDLKDLSRLPPAPRRTATYRAAGEGTPNRQSWGRSGLPVQSRHRPVRFVSPQVANPHQWDLIVHASTPNPTKLISGVSRSLSNIDRSRFFVSIGSNRRCAQSWSYTRS